MVVGKPNAKLEAAVLPLLNLTLLEEYQDTVYDLFHLLQLNSTWAPGSIQNVTQRVNDLLDEIEFGEQYRLSFARLWMHLRYAYPGIGSGAGYSELNHDVVLQTVCTFEPLIALHYCDPSQLVAVGEDEVLWDLNTCGSVQHPACVSGYFKLFMTMGTKYADTLQCCPGYYCPLHTTCMVPCSEGAYCPTPGLPAVDTKTQFAGGIVLGGSKNEYKCEPYDYYQDDVMACAGAAEDMPCPAGYYCPTPREMNICPEHMVCRKGSIEPLPCPLMSVCPLGSGSPTFSFVPFLILAALLAIAALFRFSQLRLATHSLHTARIKKATASIDAVSSEEVGHNELANEYDPPEQAHDQVASGAEEEKEEKKEKKQEGSEATLAVEVDWPICVELTGVGLTLKKNGGQGASGGNTTTPRGGQGKDGDVPALASSSLPSPSYVSPLPCPAQLSGSAPILSGITCSFQPGHMTALIGPSGAGKSSLLAVITGSAKQYGNLSGQLRFNGLQTSIDTFKDVMGLVPQHDTMYTDMTVFENLFFSARLRLPSSLSQSIVLNVVEDVLKLLRLTPQRLSLVGDASKRGISGGQLKRVNIGLELVARPSLLLLDEPTSGLDSSTSAEIMDSLNQYKQRNATLIVVIHQPRPEIFDSFDRVCLLGTGGRMVYFGPPQQAVGHFSALGYALPPFMNPADFYMDILEGRQLPDLKNGAQQKDVQRHGQDDVYLGLSSHGAQLQRASALLRLFAYWEANGKHEVPQPFPSTSFVSRVTAGGWQQLRMVAARSLVQQSRNYTLAVFDVMLVWSVAMVIGFMFASFSFKEAFGISFLISITSSITAVQQALRIFLPCKLVFLRESKAGLSGLSFFLGKNVAALPTILVMPLVFSGVYWSMAMPAAAWSSYYLILLCNQIAWTGMGQLISLLLPQEKAQLAGVIVCLAIHLVSGSNPTLGTLKQLHLLPLAAWSPARYGLEALTTAEWAAWSPVYGRVREGLLLHFLYTGTLTSDLVHMLLLASLFFVLALMALWRLVARGTL